MLDTQVLQDSPARSAGGLPKTFACSWTKDGDDAACVRLAGELDIATSPRLERTLRLAQRQARLVVVDLRRVSFVDSSALHALVDASRLARRAGRRLVILRGPPPVDRIFALCRVSDAVELADLDAAEPPVTALRRLAAEEGDLGPANVGDSLQRTA